MENPKDETPTDDLTPPAQDEDPQEHAHEHAQEDQKEDPKPVPPAGAPKKPKGSGDEDSYEDGWYQVLKRRAVGSGDHEE